MRFGLIGDVHAEDERLHAAVTALRAARVDGILCCGDLVDGHGDVDRVCSTLALHRVTTVRGNHDRWIRADEMRTLPKAHTMTALSTLSIEILKSLPKTVTLDVPGGKLLLCHGVGENDMIRLNADDSGYAISSNEDLLKVLFDATISVMVCGHTHKPWVRRFERGGGKAPLVVVNAGTLAREDNPGFAILDTAVRRVEFHSIAENLSIAPRSQALF
jgi:predicted phosphodiesterase